MRKQFDPSSARSFHLNQDGSKAVRIDANGNRETLPVSFDGVTVKERAVKYWEQCGNFGFPVVRQGKMLVTLYADSEVEPKMWMPYNVKYPNKI